MPATPPPDAPDTANASNPGGSPLVATPTYNSDAQSLLDQMTRWSGEPSGACRPFDVARDGWVPGAGAGILVLEDRDVDLPVAVPDPLPALLLPPGLLERRDDDPHLHAAQRRVLGVREERQQLDLVG